MHTSIRTITVTILLSSLFISADDMNAGAQPRHNALVKAGTVTYIIGAPFTYASIGATIIALHSSAFDEPHIVSIGGTALLLNQTGLITTCAGVNAATKHLPPDDPLRIEARKCRRYYGLGGLFALGSALICTSGGLVQWAAYSSNGEFYTFEPFLIVGLLLLPVRDIFWTKATFGANKVMKQLPLNTGDTSFRITPYFTADGRFGVQSVLFLGSNR